MYSRSKKDDYRKRIEEMIGGRKHLRGSSDNSSFDNDNTNISDNTTSVIDCRTNDSNDNITNILSGGINNDSSGIEDNGKNNELENHIKRWNPNYRVEGIHKYLEANKN